MLALVVARANGIPKPGDFELREVDAPVPANGGLLVRNRFLSADPAMRGWIADKVTY